MYGYTITDTAIDQRYSNAPDALDALFNYLHHQLVNAPEHRTIAWVFHDPDGPALTGTCGTSGPRDTQVETSLNMLHHSIAGDLARGLYEATRLSAPDATISA